MVERIPGGLLLIQFAKAPVPGRVKTRMMPELSARQACDLHWELVQWTAGRLSSAGLGPLCLAVAGECDQGRLRQLPVDEVRPQIGGDLGAKMFNALRDGLEHYSQVLLVGSDCPFIDTQYLQRAVGALRQAEVVLGPAEDGGYVLIGARRAQREWFEGVRWGTGEVLSQTRERLSASGTDWQELPALADIDRPGDLPLWRALRRQAANSPGQ